MAAPLFNSISGTPEIERTVRSVLSDAMKGCRKSSGNRREEIARVMSELLSRKVTASMLRDFTRNATKKRQVRFPAAWVPAFCKAADNDSLIRHLLTDNLRSYVKVGQDVLNSRDMWEAIAPVLAKRWQRAFRRDRTILMQAKARRTKKSRR